MSSAANLKTVCVTQWSWWKLRTYQKCNRKIQKSIPFDETCDFLISYYEKQILTGKLKQNNENKVLLTHQYRNRNFKKPKCSICHRIGHTETSCNKRAEKSKMNENNTSEVRMKKQYCKYCGMTNHNSDDCNNEIKKEDLEWN